MSEESLMSHYHMNFQLMQHHNYSLSDLDSMIPYEREIYVALLEKYLKELKDVQDAQNTQNHN